MTIHEPDQLVDRLEREIQNGAIRDAIDLEAALSSHEYRNIPSHVRDRVTKRVALIEAENQPS